MTGYRKRQCVTTFKTTNKERLGDISEAAMCTIVTNYYK
jgi:hypothetical protein